MPNINRIRVNNVKYNFGTQFYDDFVMRMYGRNTLYDLANGGGKSVLMLLLLQNLIPNCTLDEKQPIEKLFRSGSGNTTIHSLIEWNLAEEEQKDGYRYMTTGFCARKAKDSPDEQEGGKDTAAIEYFNYVIFYRDYNDNDIINLPLAENGERVSYSGWKNYLKDLSHRDMKLEVQIFERKGEYQRFISQFGLYESHWEIIRGINKTEGHVRTYFESHYRTARKVVEDLLIEEIIEKAYQVKTATSDTGEDMAHTLLEIKDKLVELSKKKREIADYDRQAELLNVLESRVSSFLELYENQEKQTKNLADVFVTGKALVTETEERIKELSDNREKQLEQMNKQRLAYESIKIQKDKLRLAALAEEIAELAKRIEEQNKHLKELKDEQNRKESMNDYLDYLRDADAKRESEAVIRAAMADDKSGLSDLGEMAYVKKVRDDAALKQWREQEEKESKLAAEATEKLKQAKVDATESDVEYGKASGEYTLKNEQYQASIKMLQELREQMTEESFLPAAELIKTEEQKQEELKEEIQTLESWIEENREKIGEEIHEALSCKAELEDGKAAIAELEEKSRNYRDSLDTIHRMLDIYGGERTASWLKNEDLLDLLNRIEERKTASIVSKAKSKDEIKKHTKRLEELKNGQLVTASDSVLKAKHYIESRHGISVLSGMEYLSALKDAQKKELIKKHPFLPYGLVVDKFSALSEDVKLPELKLYEGFLPIYDRDKLNDSSETYAEDEGCMYLYLNSEQLLSEKAIEEAVKAEEERIAELTAECARTVEILSTYDEDIDFVKGLIGMAVMDTEQEFVEAKERVRVFEERYAEKSAYAKERQEEFAAKEEALKQSRELLFASLSQSGLLRQMRQLSDAIDKEEKAVAEAKTKLEAAEIRRDETHLVLSNLQKQKEDSTLLCKRLNEQIDKHLVDWETLFLPYYTSGQDEETEEYVELSTDTGALPVLSAVDQKKALETYKDVSDEELTAKFKAAKLVYEKSNLAIEDKKKLVEALAQSMERSLRSIKKRGISEEELKDLKKEGKLFAVPEEQIEDLRTEIEALTNQITETEKKESEKRQKVDRLEGSVEQAIMTLEERFGTYHEQKVTLDAIDLKIDEHKAELEKSEREYKRTEQEYQQYTKEYSVIVDLYKDVKRIVETNGIKRSEATVKNLNKQELRTLFEESLKSYDKNVKALKKAETELTHYKNQTAEALSAMSAFEMSHTVSQNVAVPADLAEAKQLKNALKEMVEVVILERDRVEQGIEDMQSIKANFEKQCLERCLDVKSDLEKLDKLSHIILDEEPIQMVSLSIPYVKEEFVEQKMSAYIDEVVAEADRYENQNERVKFIRGKLTLKRLFGVIVTDMNAIRLTLYKRERIKEQSRYLRYEEAVGSTGQSQGIYIQFLISIINYISGLYRADVEAEKLAKTIFIDNPFGAAKDVYIWEPIFELLKTNRVQLIVPARGTTPAITSRFDVNYVLGQQMVGNKQQTVVVDYRSQVKQDELEYRNLTYEQNTFDFI